MPTPQKIVALDARSLTAQDIRGKANNLVAMHNQVLELQVKVVNTGTSQLQFGDTFAVLTLSTKDIDLGAITGSKGSNAALASLINALKRAFTVRDVTT